MVQISSLRIPEQAEVLRLPPRPLEHRNSTYDKEFDATTLFFDAFHVGESTVVLIGPPLLNLEPAVLDARFMACPTGAPTKMRYKKLDRNMQLWGTVPRGTSHLCMDSALGRLTIPLSDDCAAVFRGRRVVTTLSRNNELSWITDWLRFCARVHGCDAVLFYDNASDRYTNNELQSSINDVTEITRTVVLDWPFPYGPQGSAAGNWDSDFCQYGQLEHARWRFVRDAASVLNSDVDELVVPDYDQSVFARTESSPEGLCAFFGLWVTQNRAQVRTASSDNPESARHRDFWFTLRREISRSNTKWCVVPSRCADNTQWCVHGIPGKSSETTIVSDILYRHFRAINTRWKWRRVDAHDSDHSSFFEDIRLKSLMERAGI